MSNTIGSPDGETAILLAVSQDDIDRGRPGDPKFCPVHRAVRRTFGVRWCHLRVTGAIEVETDYPGLPAGKYTATGLDAFIEDFDADGADGVTPQVFVLRPL